MFWFVGLLPDLATLRDRSKSRWQQVIFGMLSMGWRGSAGTGTGISRRYLLLAGLATPLVLSGAYRGELRFRHGHRSRLAHDDLPPYFVAGAIYRDLRWC